MVHRYYGESHMNNKNWEEDNKQLCLVWDEMVEILGGQDPVASLCQCMDSWSEVPGEEGPKMLVFKLVILTLSLHYKHGYLCKNQQEDCDTFQDWTSNVVRPLLSLGNSSPKLRECCIMVSIQLDSAVETVCSIHSKLTVLTTLYFLVSAVF